jgi:hypothetical protein
MQEKIYILINKLMRLYELTGYKNNEIYQLGSKIGPGTGDEFDGKAYDIDAMTAFKDKLKAAGWKEIGSGWYAVVFENPKYPYVIKVVNNNPRYLKFLHLVAQNQSNPFLPKIRGKFIKLNQQTQAVRMEKLTPLLGRDDPALKKYIDPNIPKELFTHWLFKDYDALFSEENKEYLKEKFPQLLQAYNLLVKFFDYLDLEYYGNIMRRGDTLVITDPVLG